MLIERTSWRAWATVTKLASITKIACWGLLGLLFGGACGEGRARESARAVVTLPGSSVGAESRVLARQVERFARVRPDIVVELQRTPDAADQRHQLYVQWLNARQPDPDILQLDVIWTAQFAAAGWLLDLDRFAPELDDFFPATLTPNRHRGRLYALPWFVDVGMLYYRRDLLPGPPRTYQELIAHAQRASALGTRYGLVFQAARYEGLITVFLEYLTAFGGRILDEDGEVVVGQAPAIAALTALRRAIDDGSVPRAVLTYQEEQTRFVFQSGQALFMRNWPYAYPLLQRADSQVAGRFAVTALPPASPAGRKSAALGGSQLAINRNSDQPEAAYAVLRYLTAPEQMQERARVAGQFPPRRSFYAQARASAALRAALPIDSEQVRELIEHAVPRPVTPVYTRLSSILQIHVHRCLSGQRAPAQALHAAQREMTALLQRVGLSSVKPPATSPERHGPG